MKKRPISKKLLAVLSSVAVAALSAVIFIILRINCRKGEVSPEG